MDKVVIPYPGHTPGEELSHAITILRMLRLASAGAAQGIADLDPSDVDHLAGDVLEILEPIMIFMEQHSGNVDTTFLECRRAWFLRNHAEKPGKGGQANG